MKLTRLAGHSKTLIDDIFYNLTSHEVISGNITATISYHLPQLLIATNVFADPSSNKSIIFEKNRSNFNQENFLLDYFSIDWKALLKIEQQNINFSFSIINSLFDTHVPLKKICQYKLKFKTKPWMTPGLQK